MLEHRTWVALDLEMTGPQPENQQIIEIAAIKFRGDRTLESWSTLVNPRCEIPLPIQRLTGIRQEEVDRAPLFSEVADQFLAFIEDLPLVAHTISSDIGCLTRHGLTITNLQIDTYELASILLPMHHSYSLAALADYFGIPYQTTHRAAADALLTKELFLRLLERAAALDLAVLQEINRLAARLDWPLKMIFQDLERVKARRSTGVSILQQLAAKGDLAETTLELLLAADREPEAVAPVETPRPIPTDELVGWLEPGGLFARAFPGYEHRPPQTTMLRAVAEAFNRGEHLVVEAGTGTGKSVAYLVPALWHAVHNGERVVVSTNTITLQDQLCQKDLPDLQRVLPFPFRVALLKGRSNYLCLTRWNALRHRTDLSPEEIVTLIKILVWLPQTETGDVSELNLTEAERAVWQKVCATEETCTPRTCLRGRRRCFLYRARARAEGAHIVVVNHALLLSDLAANNQVLPDYRYLIIDEAHHLEDEATEQFGYSLRLRDLLDHLAAVGQSEGERVTGLAGDLRTYLRGVPLPIQREGEALAQDLLALASDARRAAREFFAVLAGALDRGGRAGQNADQRVRITPAVRRAPGWRDVELAWENLHVSLTALHRTLSRLATLVSDLEEHQVLDYGGLVGRLGGLLRFNEDLRREIQQLVLRPGEGQVYWVTLAGGEQTSLHTAPLHVGPLLQRLLFATKKSVVLTSATLAVNGSCAFIRERLGLDEARELVVDSPFDYARSTLLYLPTDLPEPDQPGYVSHLARLLIDLCTASEGRTLVLFTAYRPLREVYQAIRGPLAERQILVLGHGVEGVGRRQLLQTFRTTPRTVLLGTSSFWEGIDIVGEALSVLVIAKLPFSVPTDPVFAARSEQFPQPFLAYSVPQAVLRFKQGFGRLIRSQTDRGVVVLCDRRVLTKGYGEQFLGSLPPCTVRRGPARDLPGQVRAWLRGGQPAPVRRG